MSPSRIIDAEPPLRPSLDDITTAPELSVLAALDTILATAAFQVIAQHPGLRLTTMVHGNLPSPAARQATRLFFHLTDLRVYLRDYHAVACGQQNHDPHDLDTQINLPF